MVQTRPSIVWHIIWINLRDDQRNLRFLMIHGERIGFLGKMMFKFEPIGRRMSWVDRAEILPKVGGILQFGASSSHTHRGTFPRISHLSFFLLHLVVFGYVQVDSLVLLMSMSSEWGEVPPYFFFPRKTSPSPGSLYFRLKYVRLKEKSIFHILLQQPRPELGRSGLIRSKTGVQYTLDNVHWRRLARQRGQIHHGLIFAHSLSLSLSHSYGRSSPSPLTHSLTYSWVSVSNQTGQLPQLEYVAWTCLWGTTAPSRCL